MEAMDQTTSGVFIQQPSYFGQIEDAAAIGEAVHAAGAKFVMGIYPIAGAALKSPRECGADVVTGEGQPLGMSLAFGGPYLGFMACTHDMMRQLPGRIVGETKDVDGRRAYVLTLQAREQHIRREKASSNICSNQALCAMTQRFTWHPWERPASARWLPCAIPRRTMQRQKSVGFRDLSW